MNNYLLPLLSLITGAMLGFLSTAMGSFIRQRHDITLRLLDQYFEVRKEVVEIVSKISSRNLRDPIDSDHRNEFRDSILKLYFKHYDFLPKPVLDSLTLLYTCLAYPAEGPYTIKNNAIVVLDEYDLSSFVEACSVFENTKHVAPLALKSTNATVRANQIVILHARHVLFTLNKFTGIKELLAMTKKFKKG